MGWNWRKSVNFGPLRINLSQRGIGYSAGVRGFRIGRNAKGQDYSQSSIPGTGMYKRTYSGQASKGTNWSLPVLVIVFLLLMLLKLLLR